MTSAVNIEKQNKQQRELLTRTIDDSFKTIWFSVSEKMCKLSYVLVWSVCGAFGWWTVALQRCSPCPRVARSSRACAVPRPSAQRGACSHCVQAQQWENTKALKTILPNFSHKKQYLCLMVHVHAKVWIFSFSASGQSYTDVNFTSKLLVDFTSSIRCLITSVWMKSAGGDFIVMRSSSCEQNHIHTCSDTYRTTFCLFSLT